MWITELPKCDIVFDAQEGCVCKCIGFGLESSTVGCINPSVSNITLQILLSYCHTLHRGEFLYLPTEFMLSDHILYSHDFSDQDGVDIAKRNLILVSVGA